MKLVETYETLTEFTGEEWEPAPGKRVVPENEIEKDALNQIWELQCHKGWRLDDRDIPWDVASFRPCVEWTEDGFAKTVINFARDKFDPLNLLSNFESLEVTVYWLWENDRIQAYWSVENHTYNSRQSNQASYQVVFR